MICNDSMLSVCFTSKCLGCFRIMLVVPHCIHRSDLCVEFSDRNNTADSSEKKQKPQV